MKYKVEYLPDATLDEALDRELRNLLTTCFTKTQDVVFQERRYFAEPYPHRWLARDERGAIVAHLGLHEKSVQSAGVTYKVGGICEVCVHPDSRGRGLVKAMLAEAHAWLCRNDYAFALLFGGAGIYGSSGYSQVENLYMDVSAADGGKERKQIRGLFKQMSGTPWPDGEVYLPGLTF